MVWGGPVCGDGTAGPLVLVSTAAEECGMSVWQWVWLAVIGGTVASVCVACRAIVDSQHRPAVEDDSLRRTTDALGKVVDR